MKEAQPNLFSRLTSAPIYFDGATATEQDEQRLAGLLERVFNCMKDGRWRTLYEIQQITGGTEASVSARLRDLRKTRFGSHTVNRRSLGNGLWEYQVKV